MKSHLAFAFIQHIHRTITHPKPKPVGYLDGMPTGWEWRDGKELNAEERATFDSALNYLNRVFDGKEKEDESFWKDKPSTTGLYLMSLIGIEAVSACVVLRAQTGNLVFDSWGEPYDFKPVEIVQAFWLGPFRFAPNMGNATTITNPEE